MESVRKDVEGCFGILKQRWRILRNPVDLHKQYEIDNVFFTCCILNNVLLRYDNLDLRWTEKEWEDCDPDKDYSSQYDGSKLSTVDIRAAKRNKEVKKFVSDDTEIETDIEYFHLRAQLINHYTVARLNREVEWLD